MYNYQDDEIDALKRQFAGLPPRREILLPPDSMMASKQVTAHASKLLYKILKNRE